MNCTKCSLPIEINRSYQINDQVINLLKCGHIFKGVLRTIDNLESIKGDKLFDFQREGVEFTLKSPNQRVGILDEMGLGKTVQALSALAIDRSKLPAVFIVKSTLTVQWHHEIINWLGEDTLCQIIQSSTDFLLPNFHCYIISYDLLPKFRVDSSSSKRKQSIKSESSGFYIPEQDTESIDPNLNRKKKTENKFIEFAKSQNIQTVILDECQQIKNTEAKRTVEVRGLCKNVPGLIALSGTPIKNNAIEYFSVLNMLDPVLFPSKSSFITTWTDSYWDGYKAKAGGLKYPKKFQELTKDFIIRRLKSEVLKDLPLIQRQFSFHELEKVVMQAYEAELAKFQDEYENSTESIFQKNANLLAYIAKMRKLVGLAKIEPCIDKVVEFLGSNSDNMKKIVIFLHHHDVHSILKLKLDSVLKDLDLSEALNLTSDLNSEQRSKVVEKFKTGNNRVLIASTLSSGEGLDGLQKVSDFIIMLERQWNPSNEEQVEGRISRIGQTSNQLTALYLVAVGTIDEFFAKLVEQKRSHIKQALDYVESKWDESSLMTELMFILSNSNKKAWKL